MKEKRKLKGYKIRPSVYKRAMKRAKKENTKLATAVEYWVGRFAEGCTVDIINAKS